MRSEVLKGRSVHAAKAKSVEHAESEYGAFFRVSDRHAFRGRIRLICIDGLDVNPCSGLHHRTTDIGPYEVVPEHLPNADQHTLADRVKLCWMTAEPSHIASTSRAISLSIAASRFWILVFPLAASAARRLRSSW
ncbi:MAG: hypothetical protein AAGF88_02865 [Pseudomonadota bacterium]